MKIEHVADLSSRGHEIGSHTSTHPLLPQLSDNELRDELTESRRKLTAVTRTDILGIAYPNGDVDPRVRKAAQDAGYRYGVLTTPGVFDTKTDDKLLIPRLDMNPLRVASGPPSGEANQLAFRAQFCQLFGRWT
jgi:peptidoglycan/xylan/chitin deacetylase (PgdA/CDA1 family)